MGLPKVSSDSTGHEHSYGCSRTKNAASDINTDGQDCVFKLQETPSFGRLMSRACKGQRNSDVTGKSNNEMSRKGIFSVIPVSILLL